MRIITKEVEVKPRGAMIKYYQDKGYDANYNKSLIVKVEDLPEKSNEYIDVLCDICEENILSVRYADYNRIIKETGSYVCRKCSYIKASQTNIKKYGKPYYFETEEFAVKFKEIMFNNYGVDNPLKNKEVIDRVNNTNLQKYGYVSPSQVPEFKEKAMVTLLKRYGVDNVAKNEYIKEKIRNTNIKKYGVEYTMQNPEVRAKANETLCKNGSQKTSKQQLYLHSLFGGEINYPIRYYAVDVCLPEEKIVIEYDGGGHRLRETLGRLTKEEFDQKEIVRSNIIKCEGYKQMRIISTTDKLPSDTILLQMLQDARQYFSTTSHSWIEFNIDSSTFRNAENLEGSPYNFENLRTIKDSDLDTIK